MDQFSLLAQLLDTQKELLEDALIILQLLTLLARSTCHFCRVALFETLSVPVGQLGENNFLEQTTINILLLNALYFVIDQLQHFVA